jgi:hypothetical protein
MSNHKNKRKKPKYGDLSKKLEIRGMRNEYAKIVALLGLSKCLIWIDKLRKET